MPAGAAFSFARGSARAQRFLAISSSDIRFPSIALIFTRHK
jgi:hypothetical protein